LERQAPPPAAGARRAGAAPARTPAAADRFSELDAELRQLDRLAGVGRLAAEVAHEVRNALTAVKTFLQLLPERGDDPALRESLGSIAAGEVARIERLLELVLAQASPRRADTPVPAEETTAGCDAAEAARAVARLAERRAAAAGVRFACELPDALPPGAIAEDALRQVLLNLVLNAVDATPRGGDVRLVGRALGRAVELAVEDRGPGVPRALRRRVFEPFFSTRTDRPGGLGLAIARRLVEEAGGTIAIADRPEGGSRFRVRLPAALS
jgi:signal transduction histidine kinase